MNLWQNYLCPSNVQEALLALRDAPPPTIPIAGGTDILLDLEQGRHPPAQTLVDLTSVVEMTALETLGNELFVGSAVPLARVAAHPLVIQQAEALAEACELVGGPQVRNVATLGGNVAHALPAADGTIALLALGAQAELATLDGTRNVPVGDLFEGPGKSVLRPGIELIVGFRLRIKQAGEASAFQRVMRPQGVALPILNVGVWICRRGDRIESVRIAVGPAGPRPWRAVEAESLLTGQPYTAAMIDRAVDALLSQAVFRSSPRRASADYRRGLVGPLVRGALASAWSRAAS